MRLNQYMTSYNQRNDYESVSKCGCFVWQDQIDRVDLLRMQISEPNLELCITITHQTRPGNVMVRTYATGRDQSTLTEPMVASSLHISDGYQEHADDH